MKEQLLEKLNEGFKKSFTEDYSLATIINYNGNSLEEVMISDIFFAEETFDVGDNFIDCYTIFLKFVNSKKESSTVRFSNVKHEIDHNFEKETVDFILFAPITYDFEIRPDWIGKYFSIKHETKDCSILDKLLFDLLNEESVFNNHYMRSIAINKKYERFTTFLTGQFSDINAVKEILKEKDKLKKLAIVQKFIPDAIEILNPYAKQTTAKLKNGHSLRIFLEDFEIL